MSLAPIWRASLAATVNWVSVAKIKPPSLTVSDWTILIFSWVWDIELTVCDRAVLTALILHGPERVKTRGIRQSRTCVKTRCHFYSITKHKSQWTKFCNTQINQPTRCISLSDLLLVVQIQLNMFRASSCPSSGAYKLQQPPLVYRWNVVVAVSLVVVGLAGRPAGPTTTNDTATTTFQR